MKVSAIMLLLAVGATTGCGILDGRCGEKSRDVTVTGRPSTAGDANQSYAQLSLVEREVTIPRQSGYWLLIDESLRGHLLAARLRDATTRELLTELPFEPRSGQEAYMGDLGAYSGAVSFGALYERTRSNRLRLILRTDLAGRDSIEVRMLVISDNAWGQPYCS